MNEPSTERVLYRVLGEEMEELEFKCQVPRSSKSFVLFKNEMDQRTQCVVDGGSSGPIREKGKQLTFFIPLGPENPTERLTAVFLSTQHIQGHSLRARISIWSFDQASSRSLQTTAGRGGIETLQPEGSTFQ